MKYVSLDIETTGLNKISDQVLHVAMVADEIKPGVDPAPIDELQKFEVIFRHERITGDAFAIHMNRELIMFIAGLAPGEAGAEYNGRNVSVMSPGNVDFFGDALDWLRAVHDDHDATKFIAAGKNAAGFDLPFLGRVSSLFHHRVIDVGSVALGADPTLWGFDAPPSLGDLTDTPVTHDAMDDALDVVRAMRRLVLGCAPGVPERRTP